MIGLSAMRKFTKSIGVVSLSEKMWNMMGGVYFRFFRRPNEKSEMQREEAPSDRRSLFHDLSLSRAGNRERR